MGRNSERDLIVTMAVLALAMTVPVYPKVLDRIAEHGTELSRLGHVGVLRYTLLASVLFLAVGISFLCVVSWLLGQFFKRICRAWNSFTHTKSGVNTTGRSE
jgi:hypothetical protein